VERRGVASGSKTIPRRSLSPFSASLRSVPPPFVTAFGLLRKTAGCVTKDKSGKNGKSGKSGKNGKLGKSAKILDKRRAGRERGGICTQTERSPIP
jgi:hypothetical protein